jgi:hypothetical protein
MWPGKLPIGASVGADTAALLARDGSASDRGLRLGGVIQCYG